MGGCLFCLGAGESFGQALGAIARQERARKENQAERGTHVYTNEDLTRSRMLTTEYRQRFEAARQNGVLPLEKKPPETVTPDSGRKEVSLGDIARQYRREKLARQAQESAQFPLLLNAAPLAAPSLPVLPSNQPPDPQGTPRPEKSAQPKEFSPRIVAPDPLPHKEKLVPSRPVLKIAPSPAPIVPKPLAPKPLISESAGVQNESLRPSGGSARTPTRGLEAVSVRRGDSLWSLAAAYLGHGGRWKELLEENPWIEDPRRLGGSQVLLPIRVAAEELPGP